MAGLAFGLYLTYLVVAFGVRSWVQWRRTGSTGFRGFSGLLGSLEWCGGVLFLLALVAGMAAPVLQVAGLLVPLAFLDLTVVRVIGLALALTGIVATVVAQQVMGASWRVGVDQRETTTLVTAGVFTRVRNPVFTAMITAALGLTLLTPNPVALVGVVALVLAVQIQVRAVEEPYLLRTHGQTYLRYAAQAGRFLPAFGRLTPNVD